MVDVSRPPIGKGNVMEDWRVSPWGMRHSRGSTGLLHHPGLLKRLMRGGLNDGERCIGMSSVINRKYNSSPYLGLNQVGVLDARVYAHILRICAFRNSSES
jgi:hypothetical protein